MSSGVRSRSLVASMAIGLALSKLADLPVMKLDETNIEEYFRNTHYIPLRTKLSKLNDIVLLDHQACLEYAAKFYMQRYMAANYTGPVLTLFDSDPIYDIFGIGKYFSVSDMDVIKNNYVEFLKIHNEFLVFTKDNG
jgi:hypothetical protein